MTSLRVYLETSRSATDQGPSLVGKKVAQENSARMSGGALTSTLRPSKDARIRALTPGLFEIWSKWEPEFGVPCLGCSMILPHLWFDCSRISPAALPGQAHAHRRGNPVSDHQPVGVSLPSSQAPGRRVERVEGGRSTFLHWLP